MVHILGWIIAGLVVGAIARLLIPGRQDMGLAMTMVLGILGALIGGGISWLIWGLPGEPFSNYAWPGYLLSILGAVILLLVTASATRQRSIT